VGEDFANPCQRGIGHRKYQKWVKGEVVFLNEKKLQTEEPSRSGPRGKRLREKKKRKSRRGRKRRRI